MGEPDYTRIIERILEMMQGNPEIAKKVKEFRFGEFPEEAAANNYPALYVTTSKRAEVGRRQITGNRSRNQKGGQIIETEFYIIVVVRGAKPSGVQKRLYEFRRLITDVMEENQQLRDGDDRDRLCDSLEVDNIGRITYQRGKIADGHTMIIRTTNYK